MHGLIVRQVRGRGVFVVSHADGRSAEDEATVASPVGRAVRTGSEGKLRGELRRYLESFLDYSFPPQTTRAEAVEASLEAWGAQALHSLVRRRHGVRPAYLTTHNSISYSSSHRRRAFDNLMRNREDLWHQKHTNTPPPPLLKNFAIPILAL